MKTQVHKTQSTVLMSLLITVLLILLQSYNGFSQNSPDNEDLAYEWSESNNAVLSVPLDENPVVTQGDSLEGNPKITYSAPAATATTCTASASVVCAGSTVTITNTSAVDGNGRMYYCYNGSAYTYAGYGTTSVSSSSFVINATTTFYNYTYGANGTLYETSSCTVTVPTFSPGSISTSLTTVCPGGLLSCTSTANASTSYGTVRTH
jgi:hypothetical protein